MMQLEFEFGTAVLPALIVAAPVENAPDPVAVSDVIAAGPVEEAPVADAVADVFDAAHEQKAQPVQEGPYVVVELWDGLVSPCRRCAKAFKDKRRCARNCGDLAKFQDKLKEQYSCETSDPERNDYSFGYI
jgi:hypothetical protein